MQVKRRCWQTDIIIAGTSHCVGWALNKVSYNTTPLNKGSGGTEKNGVGG